MHAIDAYLHEDEQEEIIMDARDFIGSSGFLKAELVRDKGYDMKTLTILDIDKDEYNDKPQLVISFEEIDEKLSLNNVNTKTLIDAYGHETDSWKTKKVTIVTIDNAYQGKPGIRLKIPKEGQQ